MPDLSDIWRLAPRIVAGAVGTAFAVYRPIVATSPAVTISTLLVMSPVWITADPRLKAEMPLPETKSRGFAAVDTAVARMGDYLVGMRWDGGAVETWFVESMDLPAPITVQRCNRMLSLYRPGAAPPGADYYGGDLTATETPLLTSWPASVMQGTKGEKSDVNLPGDTRLPWVIVRLPVLPAGVAPRAADFAVDDIGQRYEVSQAVQTPMGWMLTASLAVT